MPHSDLLSPVIDIARAAGTAILDVYATDFETRAKADDSPVTEADLRAHQLIAAGLARITPGIPLLSEESAAISWSERTGWRRYWLVDPLDGTREFVSRNGEFTVNIALIENHRPVLGVVHVPFTDTTYSGIPGAGAWRETTVQPRIPIAVRKPRRWPLQVMGSRSHAAPALADALEAMGPHVLRPAGSSMKLCLVAEGAADLYPRLGPTSEWDIAAGQAVVEAAGGQVVTVDNGTALAYNTGESLLNPPFLAYGDPDCWRRWPRD